MGSCRSSRSPISATRSRPAASADCSGWRSRPMLQCGPRVLQLHQPERRHGRRAVQRASAATVESRPGFALRSSLADGRARHPPAVRQSQRRLSRLRTRRVSLHRARRWRQRQRSAEPRAESRRRCSARCCGIDVNVPDGDPTGYRVPADNPFLDGSPIRGARRDLGLRAAQSVALQLRRCGPWRHRRADHRRRRPERARRDQLRAARRGRPQLRMAAARRADRDAGRSADADRRSARSPIRSSTTSAPRGRR